MNISITAAPAPTTGDIIQLPNSEVIAATQEFSTFMGLELSRNEALLGLAALLFFFGVLLSCILRLNGATHPLKVTLGSIVVFLLASPAWAYTLEGNWNGEVSMPVLDRVFQWLEGTAPLPRNLFSLGLVILMGMLSWPILERILKYAAKKLRGPPATPPRNTIPQNALPDDDINVVGH